MSNDTPERVRALCCECGNLRTVSPNYRRHDANYSGECDDDPRGWRVTGTLKCLVCKTKTRHAIVRDVDESREHAESVESKPRASITEQAAEFANTPDRRILEQARSGYRIVDDPSSVGRGRHPTASRVLAVVDAFGKETATAFEYPNYWRIDVEYHTIKLAGLDLFSGCHGFWVRSEDEAYDWLRLFGGLACASSSADDK